MYRTYLQDIPGYDGYPGKVRKVPTGQALYNLSSDPGETVDVQEAFPEVVQDLMAVAERYRQSLGDDLTGRKGNERREPGDRKRGVSGKRGEGGVEMGGGR